MNHKHQITRAAELLCLGVLRDFIDTHCRYEPGVDEQTLYDLKLAVEEACTNVITHGYAGMNPGSIMLSIDVNEDKVILEITDFGHAFEPCEAPKPDIEAVLSDQPTSGFGLYLIYQTMDQVEYETSEDGNCLKLTKNLPIHRQTI